MLIVSEFFILDLLIKIHYTNLEITILNVDFYNWDIIFLDSYYIKL